MGNQKSAPIPLKVLFPIVFYQIDFDWALYKNERIIVNKTRFHFTCFRFVSKVIFYPVKIDLMEC